MKVTLMNAISVDGYIAGPGDNIDWVVDEDTFFAEAQKAGAVMLGRVTYDPGGEEFVVPDCTNFIITSTPEKYEGNEQLKFVGGTPAEILELISDAGFDTVVIGGGGGVNASFAAAGLIDEMILDVHPLVLGSGIRLLGDYAEELKLELTSEQDHKTFVQLRYAVR